MFRKVLVANRGEIAVRILQALRELRVPSVAVYSDPDRHGLAARLADEAYPLDGTSSTETYLHIDKLLAIARRSGAEAVHPGYGFLSENALFAERLEAAGLQLIGPTARAIAQMGDKITAKAVMEAAGVPVVPGWAGEAGSLKEATDDAAQLGYPILVKAAAGGGGKGMRRVDRPEELAAAIESARSEADKSFGDSRVFLEKYVERPRHVEVQIFGDHHGHAVHLFERECSVQRRHQKIVEESPSPALDPDLRAAMGEAAVRAALAIGYRNAGTVEFILGENRRFYFLEVNTRLQVEHPVTELVTARDLVHAQLRVAAGQPLPFRPEELRQHGHAFECRIYAEDPSRGYLPSTGRLQVYRPPAGPGVRVDSGVEAGSEVTVHYDPLLAKLIVWGEDRLTALERMDRALADFVILGVRTNLPFLRNLLRHPAFRAGELHTHFLDEHAVAPVAGPLAPAGAAVAAALVGSAAGSARSRECGSSRPPSSPWTTGGPWRSV